jgi:DNA-binding NarL/FixJ family response regulator
MEDEDIYAERVLRAGARGYIMKEAGGRLLLAAMRQVLGGTIYVSPKIAARILANISTSRAPRTELPVERLSDRELEIYRLIGQGRDSREIAHLLSVSRKTVDVHRGSIKRKLGLASSTALIRHAVHSQASSGAPGPAGDSDASARKGFP